MISILKYPFAAASVLLLTLFFTPACKKAEDIKVSPAKPEVVMTDLENDSTGRPAIRKKLVRLYKDTVYLLNSSFVREAGEQLIIDEGTLIKVSVAPNPNIGIFVGGITINPGGIITASGTVAQPIVFTSNQQDATQAANWQGLIIRGKSFNNVNGRTGIADDFSGIIKYVRVEFAPLVLEAVGNKTLVENIMVSYTNRAAFDQYQAAFSFIGGTFNARRLVAYACAGPADFYITNGYAGFMQQIIACRHPFFGNPGNNPENSLAGIFIQNNGNSTAPTATPYTNPIISNLTVLGPNATNGMPLAYADTNSHSGALVTTSSACLQIRNSVFLGYPASGWFLNDKVVAENLQKRTVVDFNYSVMHSNNPARLFYLAPGTADPYNSNDFKNYELGSFFKNQYFANTDEFRFKNIIAFDDGPNLQPTYNSPLLKGADFTNSSSFNNAFFDQTITYLGAIGNEDWTRGWTNFRPLKTNYNFPQ